MKHEPLTPYPPNTFLDAHYRLSLALADLFYAVRDGLPPWLRRRLTC